MASHVNLIRLLPRFTSSSLSQSPKHPQAYIIGNLCHISKANELSSCIDISNITLNVLINVLVSSILTAYIDRSVGVNSNASLSSHNTMPPFPSTHHCGSCHKRTKDMTFRGHCKKHQWVCARDHQPFVFGMNQTCTFQNCQRAYNDECDKCNPLPEVPAQVEQVGQVGQVQSA